jgi:hypothetical protein
MMSSFLSFLFPALGALAALLIGRRGIGIWIGAGIGALFSFIVFLVTGY